MKKATPTPTPTSTALALAVLLAGAALAPRASRADLISYWPLDETEGESAADSVSGNDAAWQNAGLNLAWVAGRVGGAAQLTDAGGAAANNYFVFDVPQLVGAEALTIAAWVNPEAQTSSPYNGIVMTRNFNGGTTSWGLAIENNGDERFDSRVEGAGIDSPNGLLAPAAGWVHIAMVWDGVAGTHTQYVNGVETASAAGFGGTIAGPESRWHIGYDSCCGDTRDFDGAIDEVAFWNEALSPDKVVLLAAGIRPSDLDAEDIDGDGLPNTYEDLFAFLDPSNGDDAALDEDSDGLTNLEEFQNDTTPDDPDSDGDGIEDGPEVKVHGSNPNAADTDGDGIEDGEEIAEGADGFVTNPTRADTDGDGIPDLEEITGGTDPNDAEDPPPPPPGLVGYWSLDDGQGDIAADLVSGNDGIWQNPDSANLEWVPGQIGGAARLSDLGGNSFFRIERINPLLRSSAFSISAWIDPDDNPGYNGIFTSRQVNGGNGSWGLAMQNDAGGANHLDTRVDNQATDSAADTLPPDGGWFHVAMVWDGEAGTHTQYINGVETATAGGALVGPITGTSGPWFIGYDDCCGGGREFNGTIDDIGFWNTALTAEAISMIYQNGLEGVGLQAVPPAINVAVSRVDDTLVLDWDSRPAKRYHLRSETDLALADPAAWPIFEGHADLPATPPTNSLAVSFPAGGQRFFVIEEFSAPGFTDDFENGPGGWTTLDNGVPAGTRWELGTPTAGATGARGGENAFGTDLDADFEDGTVNEEVVGIALRSPVIDLEGRSRAILVFWYFLEINDGNSGGRLNVLRGDDGSSITVAPDFFVATTPEWTRYTYELPQEALDAGSVILEWEFLGADDAIPDNNGSGWFIDDVEIVH